MGRDARIAYGARCTWWGSIHEVSTLPSGIPCCPSCRGVLMEMPDLETWERNVEKHAEKSGDREYPAFIRWLRGRCLPNVRQAREQFEHERVRKFATDLVRKLDVALPQLDGVVAFTSLRAGTPAYEGPSLEEEIEGLRALLGLPKPAAEPHEFYPEGYCETCKGSGEVPGGEGIRDRFTRMNMRRHVVAVKDRGRAVAWLLKVGAAESEEEASAMLDKLPLDLEHIGRREVDAIYPDGTTRREIAVAPTGEIPDAELMFEIEERRLDADRPPERRVRDICPDCRGTGGIGREVPAVGHTEDGEAILATEVEK